MPKLGIGVALHYIRYEVAEELLIDIFGYSYTNCHSSYHCFGGNTKGL